MPIAYDDDTGGFKAIPDFCPMCSFEDDDEAEQLETARNDTGCDAPGCGGYSFDCCGTGCDAGWPGSRCDKAAAAESLLDRDARISRERAVWGLPGICRSEEDPR